MGKAGLFQGERVELLKGQIFRQSPQGSRHAAVVSAIDQLLKQALGRRFTVRVQMPLALNDAMEPEPDVAVVAGKPIDFRDRHPATAALVVEVADGSLLYDRKKKTAVHAKAGIPECWIVDLRHNVVQVCREPVLTGRKVGYGEIALMRKGEFLRPLGAPRANIDVKEVLL
jgi:Uma2 family endonuclease